MNLTAVIGNAMSILLALPLALFLIIVLDKANEGVGAAPTAAPPPKGGNP